MIGDETEQEDTFVSPQQQQQPPSESLTSDTPTTTGISSTKGKLNRKKRRRREYISKHSRNNSKTSLKDMVHSDGMDDDASGKFLITLTKGSDIVQLKKMITLLTIFAIDIFKNTISVDR